MGKQKSDQLLATVNAWLLTDGPRCLAGAIAESGDPLAALRDHIDVQLGYTLADSALRLVCLEWSMKYDAALRPREAGAVAKV